MKEGKLANDSGVTSESNSSPSTKSSPPSSPSKKGKNLLNCQVVALDGTQFKVEVEKNADGEVLFVKVVDKLNVIEKDYFGLRFTPKSSQNEEWLDLHKGIKKQLSNSPPNFTFCVKFYEPEPARLLDEYTRYLLYLQLRNDVVTGRLKCPSASYAILGSFTAQAELGDFDPLDHQNDYLDDYQFSPEEDAQVLQRVKDLHRQHRGQTPAQAELNFLEHAKRMPNYGVDVHLAKDEKGNLVDVGVAPVGFIISNHLPVDDDEKERTILDWQHVDVISYKRKAFHVRLKPQEKKKEKVKRNYDFKLPSTKSSKTLYKAAVEYHTFYRLTIADSPRKKGTLKIGSKFRYSDRTLYQLRSRPNLNDSGETSMFSRSPSKRRTVHGVPGSKTDEEPASKSPRVNEVNVEPAIQYEEIEMDEMDPNVSQYEKEDWEIIEKIMPDGSRKRIRRRIITTTTTTTTTTYVLHGDPQEEEGTVMEIKSLEESGVPNDEKPTENDGGRGTPDHVKEEGLPERPPLIMNIATPEHSPRPCDIRTENFVIEDVIQSEKTPVEEEIPDENDTSSVTHRTHTTVTTVTTVTTLKSQTEHEEPQLDAVKEEEVEKEQETLVESSEDYDLAFGEAVIECAGEEEGDGVRTAKLVLEKDPEIDRAEVAERAHISQEELRPRRHKSATLDRNFKRRPPPEKAHRHSYGHDVDDYYDERETMTMPRKGKKKVQLITREEMIRAYSSGGLTDENVIRTTREKVAPEIQYSLKDDLKLTHEQGESGFVRGQIGRHESVSKVQNGDGENDKRAKKTSIEEGNVSISVVTKPISFSDDTERVETVVRVEPPEIKTSVNVVNPNEEEPEEAVFELVHTDEFSVVESTNVQSEPPEASDVVMVPAVPGPSPALDLDEPDIKEPGLVETQTVSMSLTEPANVKSQLMSSTFSEPGMVETRAVSMGETLHVQRQPAQIITTTTTLPGEYSTQIVTLETTESALSPEEIEKLMSQIAVGDDESISVSSTVAKKEVVKTVKTTHVQKRVVTESKAMVSVSGETDEEMQKLLNEALANQGAQQITYSTTVSESDDAKED